MSAVTRPYRVLLAESEPRLRRDLEEVLGRLRLEVVAVPDFEQMQRALATGDFNLLIAAGDFLSNANAPFVLRLPVEYPHLATIITTGNPAFQTVLTSLRAGACDFLIRPFGLEDLKAALIRAGVLPDDLNAALAPPVDNAETADSEATGSRQGE